MGVVREDAVVCKELRVGATPGGAGGGSAASPSMSFGDGDTGFYESGDDDLRISLSGTTNWRIVSTTIRGNNAAGPAIINEAASATNPTLLPNVADPDTGLGWSEADAIALVAGGVNAISFTEASSEIIQKHSANVGLTADIGSSQGDGPILSTYNVYDTVGTAGDAATLPAVFAVGSIIYIKNGAAANSMDVFPASGDDLGQGANNAEALAAGDFAVYIGTTSNATWEKLMGGTA